MDPDGVIEVSVFVSLFVNADINFSVVSLHFCCACIYFRPTGTQ